MLERWNVFEHHNSFRLVTIRDVLQRMAGSGLSSLLASWRTSVPAAERECGR